MVVYPQKTRGYSIGFITDTHVNSFTDHLAHLKTGVEWLVAQGGSGLKGLVFCGDGPITETTVTAGTDYEAWLRTAGTGPALDSSIPSWPCIGNWDTTSAPGNFGDIAENPHQAIKSRYPNLFRGHEWYKVDVEHTRIIFCNNLTDYLDDDGQSKYANCNPPGIEDELNNDHSGFTTAGSAQKVWLDSVSSSPHNWKIIICHRPMWAPFDSDPRKLNRLGRAVLKTPIDNGVSLIVQGDIHVGSHSGPWYPGSDPWETYVPDGTGNGAHSLTLSGGVFVRSVDNTVLPDNATTCHWSSGSDDGTQVTHIAWLRFEGDVAELKVFEIKDEAPAGAVVHTATLTRNPGA